MENRTDKAGYFVLGIGLGVAVGILFAPRSGRETREFLTRKAGEGVDCTRRAARETVEQVHDLIHRGEQAVAHQREAISEAVQAYRSQQRRPNGAADTESKL